MITLLLVLATLHTVADTPRLVGQLSRVTDSGIQYGELNYADAKGNFHPEWDRYFIDEGCEITVDQYDVIDKDGDAAAAPLDKLCQNGKLAKLELLHGEDDSEPDPPASGSGPNQWQN